MKIAFFSGSDFTLPLLKKLCEHHSVVLVTKPPVILRGKYLPSKLELFAKEQGLAVLTPTSFKKLLPAELKEMFDALTLGVVASYGKILPQNLLDIFQYGLLNWHPSLLPKYRGATPVQTMITNGDTVSGLTWINMDAGMDTGDIVLQTQINVTESDSTIDFLGKAIDVGVDTIEKCISIITSPNAKDLFIKQDNSLATYTTMLSKSDALIKPDFFSAKEVSRHVRAYSQFPKTEYIDSFYGVVRILTTGSTTDFPKPDLTRGSLIQSKNKTYLTCNNSFLELKTVMLSSGKIVDFSGVVF